VDVLDWRALDSVRVQNFQVLNIRQRQAMIEHSSCPVIILIPWRWSDAEPDFLVLVVVVTIVVAFVVVAFSVAFVVAFVVVAFSVTFVVAFVVAFVVVAFSVAFVVAFVGVASAVVCSSLMVVFIADVVCSNAVEVVACCSLLQMLLSQRLHSGLRTETVVVPEEH